MYSPNILLNRAARGLQYSGPVITLRVQYMLVIGRSFYEEIVGERITVLTETTASSADHAANNGVVVMAALSIRQL